MKIDTLAKANTIVDTLDDVEERNWSATFLACTHRSRPRHFALH